MLSFFRTLPPFFIFAENMIHSGRSIRKHEKKEEMKELQRIERRSDYRDKYVQMLRRKGDRERMGRKKN